jgi:hypothetical protein
MFDRRPAAPADEPPETFADGVFDVGFGAGMVRIDLFSLSAVARDAEGRPQPKVRRRIVMPLQGFLSGLATLEGMRDRLIEAGVPIEAGASPPTTSTAKTAASAAVRPAATPRSPNFDDPA